MKNLYLSIQLFAISFFAVAQETPIAFITIQEPEPICSQGNCIELTTEYSTIRTTTDYVINSIPFSSIFPFTGGTMITATGDDSWSPIVTLPFTFNFYGNCYNNLLVGTNGVITFDIGPQVPLGYCNWPFTATIPAAGFPIKNAIYGVYQDTNIASPPVVDPQIQNVNYFILDTGVNAAPNRVFVVNFNELPQYACNSSVGLQTSQIVLHETTNVIDVYVKSRTSCTTWNSGSGLIGIQNQAGTIAYAPPGRNTGTWNTLNEAWRISPNGGNIPASFSWYNNGLLIADAFNDSLLVCPTAADSYSVQMSISNCDASQTTVISNEVNQLLVAEPAFASPQDLIFCTESPFVYVANLGSNTNIILEALNPLDFEVTYYENMTDAENGASNNISNVNAYSFTENKTIYAAIQENFQTGCRYIKPFQLIIIPAVNPPTGNSLQSFSAGQTLENLVVEGENLTWYDAATEGNILPTSTLLQDGATYYVSQSIGGCESRNVNSNRLAITVNLVLNAVDFSNSAFQVYPNPATESITISCKNVIQSIQISNAIGQEIFAVNPNEKETKLTISQLPNGLYFLRLNASNSIKTIKIVKE
ncbi:MAG: T9SS type A sorting domain-containing protein [Flavobacterium sp.]|nr:T9SS type A sorting domain-containing protein [Flavobacterium sp.]